MHSTTDNASHRSKVASAPPPLERTFVATAAPVVVVVSCVPAREVVDATVIVELDVLVDVVIGTVEVLVDDTVEVLEGGRRRVVVVRGAVVVLRAVVVGRPSVVVVRRGADVGMDRLACADRAAPTRTMSMPLMATICRRRSLARVFWLDGIRLRPCGTVGTASARCRTDVVRLQSTVTRPTRVTRFPRPGGRVRGARPAGVGMRNACTSA